MHIINILGMVVIAISFIVVLAELRTLWRSMR